MLISGITEERFKTLFTIEVQKESSEEWYVWTVEPFGSKEEAEAHRQKMLDTFKHVKPEKVRVIPYREDHWRLDTLQKILVSRELTRQALDMLSTPALSKILREGHLCDV